MGRSAAAKARISIPCTSISAPSRTALIGVERMNSARSGGAAALVAGWPTAEASAAIVGGALYIQPWLALSNVSACLTHVSAVKDADDLGPTPEATRSTKPGCSCHRH